MLRYPKIQEYTTPASSTKFMRLFPFSKRVRPLVFLRLASKLHPGAAGRREGNYSWRKSSSCKSQAFGVWEAGKSYDVAHSAAVAVYKVNCGFQWWRYMWHIWGALYSLFCRFHLGEGWGIQLHKCFPYQPPREPDRRRLQAATTDDEIHIFGLWSLYRLTSINYSGP